MQVTNLISKQVIEVNDFDDAESICYSDLGAVFCEVEPGAPLLSRQQIRRILIEATRDRLAGRSADVTISVLFDGSVNYRIDYPGLKAS